MPLSYQGFGPAAILLMVLCVIVSELYKRWSKKKKTILEVNADSANKNSY
jgi:hypothetical protein